MPHIDAGLWLILPQAAESAQMANRIFINTWATPPTLCFGKHKGASLRDPDVSANYLQWAYQTLDMDAESAEAVVSELSRRLHAGSSDQRRSQYHRSYDPPPPPPSRVPAMVNPKTALEIISAGRQSLAKRYHPDKETGDHTKMVAINATADYLEAQAAALVGASL